MDPRYRRLSDQQSPMVSAQHGPADWDMDHLSWVEMASIAVSMVPLMGGIGDI